MNPLTLEDFPTFFHELHGREPYDWQCRLAGRVIQGSWPGAIDLPTGSGKTSCLDIAVFALACQAALPKEKQSAARRIFFCVNRRVIVDEAHQRAEKIASKLLEAENRKEGAPILKRVAAWLRKLSTLKRESAPPLDVLELRGGIYRDNRWARFATQPTVVCTTIDQLGSRLLFRGYGVSSNAAPIQAALIAYDSLVLLDEAHISQPFLQTLDYVKRYLDPKKWAEKPVGVKPMIVVPMTATPPEGVGTDQVFELPDSDKQGGLKARLEAHKKAKLPLPVSDVAQASVAEATSLASGGPTAVGIIVNRVKTARAIYDRLREFNQDKPDVVVELVIGSMRPIDRDRQAERLRQLVGPDRPPVTSRTSFIVATQCLEVGADYDFDALVTECASLDALRQRFGRLNRGGRKIDAKAVILAGEKDIKEESKLDKVKPLDPIYGNALTRTWNWLRDQADVVTSEAELAGAKKRGKKKSASEERIVNFGIAAFKPKWDSLEKEDRQKLSAPSASKNAPVMLPAYVDFWCQTSPRPTPDPEVALFIHGPEAGEPDVQVCWRADLDESYFDKEKHWCDVVALLPPTSAECMSVPISRVRKWLTRVEDVEDTASESDLLGTPTPKDEEDNKQGKRKSPRLEPSRVGVLWRGSRESRIIGSPNDLRPGDTLVLPALAKGWEELGHIPEPSPETIDAAETAFQSARDRAALRLHPSLRSRLPASETIDQLLARIADSEDPLSKNEKQELVRQIVNDLGWSKKIGQMLDEYPDDRGVVVMSRKRLNSSRIFYVPISDDGQDERSQTTQKEGISLKDHTEHVRDEAMRTVRALPLEELEKAYHLASCWHDLGKADERFQAMLRRTDRTDAWLLVGMNTALLAKSDGLPQTREQHRQARQRSDLPEGFRHEMLSVQIVEQSDLRKQADEELNLILHLIASHHGYARPFAPVVIDPECPEVTVDGDTKLTGDQRKACPPHRIDSGIAERFWDLTRCYGWWGLAYLEAVLRLADQQASANEDEGRFDNATPSTELAETTS